MKKIILCMSIGILTMITSNAQNKKSNTIQKNKEVVSNLYKNNKDESDTYKFYGINTNDPYLVAQAFYERHLDVHKVLEGKIKRLPASEQADQLWQALSKKYSMPTVTKSPEVLTILIGYLKKSSNKNSRIILSSMITKATFDRYDLLEVEANPNGQRCKRLKEELHDALVLWEDANGNTNDCKNNAGYGGGGTGNFVPGIGGGFNQGGGGPLQIDSATGDPEWDPCRTEIGRESELANKVNKLIGRVNRACGTNY